MCLCTLLSNDELIIEYEILLYPSIPYDLLPPVSLRLHGAPSSSTSKVNLLLLSLLLDSRSQHQVGRQSKGRIVYGGA